MDALIIPEFLTWNGKKYRLLGVNPWTTNNGAYLVTLHSPRKVRMASYIHRNHLATGELMIKPEYTIIKLINEKEF